MKWYGGTSPYDGAIGDGRDDDGTGGDPYSTPNHMHRAESVGGDTAQTNETEPLLGERLLLSGTDDVECVERQRRPDGGGAEDMVGPKSLFPSPILLPGCDVSTIAEVRSVDAASSSSSFPATPAATTSTVAGRRAIPTPPTTIGRKSSVSGGGGGSSSPWKLLVGSDPRMGYTVIANSELELDTLAYSRDHDDSTLFTSDDFVRRLSTKSLLLCIGLAVGVGLCSIAAIVYNVELSNKTGDDASSSSLLEGTWFGVPYAKITRESFGDPISGIMDVSLFHPSLLHGGRVLVGSNSSRGLANDPRPFLRVPFPTGAFWTNLIVLPVSEIGSSSTRDQKQYSYPIVAYPYSFQWSSLGKLQVSYSASRRVVRAKTINDEFAPDVTIGSVEAINARHVVKFDSLSVTLRFYSGDSIQRSWETYIVQGSPYVTAVYSGLSPELRALSDFNDIMCPPTHQEGDVLPQQQHKDEEGPNERWRELEISASSSSTSTATAGKMMGICDVATDSSNQKKVVTGVQFVVTTKEGLTWLVFTSEPITFEFDPDTMRLISSRGRYSGVIRLALVPPALDSDGSTEPSLDIGYLQSSSGVKRLIYHAGTYPIGGVVSWDFRSGMRNPLASSTSPGISSDKAHSRRAMEQNMTRYRMTTDSPKDNNIGTITFSFDTNHMTASSPSSDVPLLMLALPHHAASISSAEALLLLYECTAISALDQSIRDLILKTVESDLKVNIPDLSGGAYSFGKQIARLAQLAHIAEVVDAANMIEIDEEVNRIKNDTDNDLNRKAPSETGSLTSLRAFALLEKYLTVWLGGDSNERLVYDVQLGGILSRMDTSYLPPQF
ncbi:hypothetical protein ACHAXA_011809 [Cyclostephanos tholiformis]|uniref:Glycosyl hydrolase family 81 N-terminal domain-containing protein n=1 Tax=Cyclostephanos tholiformis TaxID=382380 RepID=A0ABD3RE77_9STRA